MAGKKTQLQRPKQKAKVQQVQDLRRSSAAGPHKLRNRIPENIVLEDDEDFDLFDWLAKEQDAD
jgi:hypothetical protein